MRTTTHTNRIHTHTTNIKALAQQQKLALPLDAQPKTTEPASASHREHNFKNKYFSICVRAQCGGKTHTTNKSAILFTCARVTRTFFQHAV